MKQQESLSQRELAQQRIRERRRRQAVKRRRRRRRLTLAALCVCAVLVTGDSGSDAEPASCVPGMESRPMMRRSLMCCIHRDMEARRGVT